MPREVLSVQVLDATAGEALVFTAVNADDGHQVPHNGEVAILIRTAAASGVDISFPSAVCSHGRLGDLGPFSVGASALRSYGPFSDPKIWGNGAGILYIDIASPTGTVEIAAIRTG